MLRARFESRINRARSIVPTALCALPLFGRKRTLNVIPVDLDQITFPQFPRGRRIEDLGSGKFTEQNF